MVANISDIRRTTVANWPIERAMLDNWARWLRRNRYLGAPRKYPQCNIGKIMDVGMPTGPVRYSDEAVDVDEEAEFVQAFMDRQARPIYRALIARHLREIVDHRGNRYHMDGAREKELAVKLYGGSISAAVRRMQRTCDEGYQLLDQYSRLDSLSCVG